MITELALATSMIYFSTITHGAIGYGDAQMTEEWRLVSAIEGINAASIHMTLLTAACCVICRRTAEKFC